MLRSVRLFTYSILFDLDIWQLYRPPLFVQQEETRAGRWCLSYPEIVTRRALRKSFDEFRASAGMEPVSDITLTRELINTLVEPVKIVVTINHKRVVGYKLIHPGIARSNLRAEVGNWLSWYRHPTWRRWMEESILDG